MKKFQPQPGCVVQAYRFALDANTSQERALRSHCGAARAAYNWAVSWVTASWWQRKAEEDLRRWYGRCDAVAVVVASRAAQGVQRGQDFRSQVCLLVAGELEGGL